MGPYKQFLASDITVTPFTVNKSFSFPYSQFATGSDGQLVGIDRFIGTNGSWDYSNLSNNPTTGTLSTQYQVLVYNSIKQLYYSNFLTSSTGDNVSQPNIFIGSNPSGDVLIGNVNSPIYDNFLQSTLVPNRSWPTGSIGVISIPSKIYGDYIQPNSFQYTVYATASSNVVFTFAGPIDANTSTSGSININGVEFYVTTSLTPPPNNPSSSPPIIYVRVNTGTGTTNQINAITASLNFSSSISPYNTYLGDITASRFIVALRLQAKTPGTIGNSYFTQPIIPAGSQTNFTGGIPFNITDDGQGNLISGSLNIGNIIYTHGLAIITNQLSATGSVTITNVTCSFSSSYNIYETQYKCTIRENEFNATLNPSAQLSGSGQLANNVTGSYFSPYVSTVGLYDENQNLLAIGKLAQPLPTSATTDTTILINLDR